MKAALNSITSFGSLSSSNKSSSSSSSSAPSNEILYKELIDTAQTVALSEPLLALLLKSTIINPKNSSFESVIARTISTRLVQSCGPNPVMCVESLTEMFAETMQSKELEHGHTMTNAIRMDMLAHVKRDPACESPLEVLLYFKGFASLVCHRAARRVWKKSLVHDSESEHVPSSSLFSRHVSLWLQSQASAAFGLDIHPGAEIGAGIMFDHGTGIVIGETATVGDNCTFLHGVTLGGTGKDSGDRHPKVAANVLIGAGASILGNIKIGRGAKIGAGSIVLTPIPHGATAVGSPAKIIGFAKEPKPGSSVDNTLNSIVPIGGLDSDTDSSGMVTASSDGSFSEIENQPKKERRLAKLKLAPFFSNRKPHNGECDANKSMCAFRSFRCKKGIPRGAVSYKCLHEALGDYSVPEDAIGEVYMSLLKMDPGLGYIPAKDFAREFSDVAEKYTQLDIAQCKNIMSRLLVHVPGAV